MIVGTEWIVDAAGCRAEALGDLAVLRQLCDEIILQLELRVVGEPAWHQFPDPGGVTGLFLLTESHLTCHTYPERGIASFNLYCCRSRPVWVWEKRLVELLGARRVTVRQVSRGPAEEARP